MVDPVTTSRRSQGRAFVIVAVIVLVAAVAFFVLHNTASYHEAENQQAMENQASPGHGNAQLQ